MLHSPLLTAGIVALASIAGGYVLIVSLCREALRLRGIRGKRDRTHFMTLSMAFLGTAVLLGEQRATPTQAMTLADSQQRPPPTGSGYVVETPTISTSHIEQILAQAHSPARGLGTALDRLGSQHHINPAYALAFFHHESRYGVAGVATVTHSIGNIRCTPGWPSCFKGYRSYANWVDGTSDWYNLITHRYVEQGLDTVKKIVPVYAPSSDSNDVDAYIHDVLDDVARWKHDPATL